MREESKKILTTEDTEYMERDLISKKKLIVSSVYSVVLEKISVRLPGYRLLLSCRNSGSPGTVRMNRII